MLRFSVTILILTFLSSTIHAQVTLTNIRVEKLVNPLGIGRANPDFSWQLSSANRNISQSFYEIRVAASGEGLKSTKNLLWNSGKVNSSNSLYVPYEGKPLESGKRYYWQVRIWDNNGNVSSWSSPGYWQMGMLTPEDWTANWIGIGFPEDTLLQPGQLFRKTFNSSKKLKSAIAFITSRGMYEAHINGKRVGDFYFTPGWTSYNKRLQYQVYDVSDLIATGENAIGVSLGSGWYRTILGWTDNKNLYGKDLALLFELHLNYSDGSTEKILSGNDWRSAESAIRTSELYDGEIYDATREKTGWTNPSYRMDDWHPVKVVDYPKNNLVSTVNEPVRKQETLQVIKLITTPEGDKVLDFGQNMVGWVKVRAKGKRGDSIRITHAEVLDKYGNFYTENLRAAKQRNIYVLKGEGTEEFEPHFTFQGFRYARIEGIDGNLKPEDFTAIVMYSDMEETGQFTTSNPMINQLQQNIKWGQKGNFVDVPTDCPQRDERLGWTGDAQVFSKTASYNMGVHNFFVKWLKDLAADQKEDGRVPHVIPNIFPGNDGGSAGWADAATVIPWDMYTLYGDKRILEEQYTSMKAHVKFMENNSVNDLWNKGFHFGDWLFFSVNNDVDGRSAVTDKYLIAQCFFAHSTQLLINTAKILDLKEDITYFENLLKRIKSAFFREYVTANGRMVSNTQTAYTLALNFDMLPEGLRQQAADRLVENIKSYNHHITTGFLGTPYLCHVLTRYGHNDIAYKLLLQESYPSWLYPVKMGATTIWERWDGQKPDSSFQTATMNSFNHYAYGAIGDWMYRIIAGINTDTAETAYKKSIIKPQPGGGLTSAAGSLNTYYGLLRSDWKLSDDKFILEVEIPANTSSVIYIPSTGNEESITENAVSLSRVKNIEVIGKADGFVMVKVGSGKYRFVSNLQR